MVQLIFRLAVFSSLIMLSFTTSNSSTRGIDLENTATSAIFIRVFKYEKILEVWEQKHSNSRFVKIKNIPICGASGELGPKRQQGDEQVPEGFYQISAFNPNSQFHLSIKVDYPNRSDKIRTSNPRNPGGQIMIHGGCGSIGCIAIGNKNIEYLYNLLERQKVYGQSVLPVHIFPCKMNALRYDVLAHLKRNNRGLLQFWKELEAGFYYFERNKRVPQVKVSQAGQYQLFSKYPLL